MSVPIFLFLEKIEFERDNFFFQTLLPRIFSRKITKE